MTDDCPTCRYYKAHEIVRCANCPGGDGWALPLAPAPTGGKSPDEIEAEIARLKRRVAELLEANNLYLERARAADRDIRFQRMQILHLTGAIGADALIAVVDDNARLRAKLAEIGARPRRRRWRPYV